MIHLQPSQFSKIFLVTIVVLIVVRVAVVVFLYLLSASIPYIYLGPRSEFDNLEKNWDSGFHLPGKHSNASQVGSLI